jgi:hypothetical protein
MTGSLVGQLALGVKADLERFRADLRSGATKAGDEVGSTLGARIKARLSAADLGTTFGATLRASLEGLTARQLQLDEAAAAFARETGASADEAERASRAINAMAGRNLQSIAEIGTTLAKVRTDLGLTGEVAERETERFLRYAEATGQAAPDAVLAFDDVLDAWGLAATDSAGIMDMLIESHQRYGGSITDNQRLLAGLAPTLQAANLDLEDANGLLNLFARAGVGAEAAQTAFTRALGKVGSPEELQSLLADISAIEDPFVRAQKAADLFGARAGTKLAQALSDADGDLGRFNVSIEDSAGAMDEARDAGLTMGDKVQLGLARIASMATEVLGPAGPLLTAVASLSTLGGPLARGLVAGARSAFARLGGDAALRAAIGAAGTAAGAVYHAAAFAAGKLLAAAQAAWATLGGSQVLGSVRSLGGLAGGAFGTAFKMAAVAGVALLWVEVWQQFQAFQAKVAQAQADLQAKIDAATQQTGSEAIANLRNLTTTMRELQGMDRMLADTFGGQQQVEGLRNLALGIKNDASLTATEIEDALDLLADASEEALARGNAGIAAEIDAIAATLRARGPAVAQAVETAYDPLSSIQPPALPAVEPPAVAAPIAEEFADARHAITQGFGSVKQALADPPALISREDRLANMETRLRKVMRNLRKAVEADDPLAVDYWTRAAAKQRTQIDRMENRTTASVDDIRAAFAKAGVRIDGTWLAIGRGADRAKGKVGDVEDAVEDLPARHDTVIAVETGSAQRRITGLRDAFRSLPTTVRTGVVTSIRESQHIGGLQHGGRVQAGHAYLVGEVRPELFVPDSPGRIEPRPSLIRAGSAGGRGDTTVNLAVHGLPMRARTPAEVVEQLRRAGRMGILEPRRQAAWSPAR